jgi:hypothetical protein
LLLNFWTSFGDGDGVLTGFFMLAAFSWNFCQKRRIRAKSRKCSLCLLSRVRVGDFQWKGFIMDELLKQLREIETELGRGLGEYFARFNAEIVKPQAPFNLRLFSECELFCALKGVKTLKQLLWADARAQQFKDVIKSPKRRSDAEKWIKEKVYLGRIGLHVALDPLGIDCKIPMLEEEEDGEAKAEEDSAET